VCGCVFVVVNFVFSFLHLDSKLIVPQLVTMIYDKDVKVRKNQNVVFFEILILVL
jgi:hypothetical protein